MYNLHSCTECTKTLESIEIGEIEENKENRDMYERNVFLKREEHVIDKESAHKAEKSAPMPIHIQKRTSYKILSMFKDLLYLSRPTKKEVMPVVNLLCGILLCIGMNKITVVSINTGSEIIGKLSNKNPEAIDSILKGFLWSTLHSVLRELFGVCFMLYTNSVVFKLSDSIFLNAVSSSAQMSSVKINRTLERGRRGIDSVLSKTLNVLISKSFGIGFVLFGIYEISSIYFLIVIAVNIVYCIVTRIFIRRRIRYKKKINMYDELLNTNVLEAIENQDVIACSNTEQRERNTFSGHLKNLLKAKLNDKGNVLFLNILQKLIYSLLIMGLLTYVYYESRADITGTAIKIIGLITILDRYVMAIALAVKDISVSSVDCEECLSLWKELKNEQKKRKEAITEHSFSKVYYPMPSVLVFENVGFRYSTQEGTVLKNLNFLVKENEKVCLIGKSGSGKSTLLSLLRKKYKYSGNIFFQERNIEGISKEEITEKISIVPQDSGMFSNTLEYNIKYKNPDVSYERFQEVTRAMGVDKIAESKENGYEYLIEEGGRNLSGGEKQRIALARALLANPSIVILDESTSKIDSDTEYQIITYLKSLPITLIVITHSASVSEIMDRTIVIS
ncbi:hypothetical protein NECID01_1656 [Nematocida sp. AWRm77]|nr:hypothetical protein NECID01_1656 [Nematocida sp. AWRm77]